MDTLSEVRKDVARFVGDSGTCADDERVLTAINDVRRILYPLGDWKNTTQPLCIQPCCGIITLPNQYEYVRKAYRCNGTIQVDNGWYSVLDGCNHYCGGFVGLLQKIPGEFVTFTDWPMVFKGGKHACGLNGFYVKLIFEDSQDIGISLTFTGRGLANREVSLTRICTAAWTDSLALPGEEKITQLLTVVKPVTKGRVRVYGYDGANEFLLAVYDKGDSNPTYQRYTTYRRAACHLFVNAKKKFYKLTEETQLVDIATDALIHGLQAIANRENRDIVQFGANLRLATDFLNAELKGPQSTSTSPIHWSRLGTPMSLIFN